MTSRVDPRGWDTLGVAVTPPLGAVATATGQIGNDGDYLGLAGRTADILIQESNGGSSFLGAWTDTSQVASGGVANEVMAATVTVR